MPLDTRSIFYKSSPRAIQYEAFSDLVSRFFFNFQTEIFNLNMILVFIKIYILACISYSFQIQSYRLSRFHPNNKIFDDAIYFQII